MAQETRTKIGSFSGYLMGVARIDAARSKRYVQWAQRFVRDGYDRITDREQALKAFSRAIQLVEPPWEVSLAISAVRHYWYWRDRGDGRGVTRAGRGQSGSAQSRSRLLERCRSALRLQHKSYRTEQSYVGWVTRFLKFCGDRSPQELGAGDVKLFLTYLAVERRVAATTQEQAFNALLFFYRYVLDVSIDGLSSAVKARKSRKLPVVLSPKEIKQIITQLDEPYSLMVRLMYATGLRLSECLQIRIGDIDMDTETLMIRGAKGEKDRPGLLPASTHIELQRQIDSARRLYDSDRHVENPGVPLPGAPSVITSIPQRYKSSFAPRAATSASQNARRCTH